MFDPGSKEYDSNFKDLKKPGIYLLGCRKAIKHGETRNGKVYTRFAFVVIDGPEKGASFVDRVFRSKTSYRRLAAICRAMRIAERWNPSDESEVERIMVGRAFKSSVDINDGGYAELKFPKTEWTEEELVLMQEWEEVFRRRAKSLEDRLSEDLEDPGFSDDDLYGSGGGGYGGGGRSRDEFDDDDIPF